MKRREDMLQALLADYRRVMVQECPALQEGEIHRISKGLLRALQLRFGGEEIYIPRVKRYDEAAVLHDFNGNNAQEVMRKHNIPEPSFYRLLARVRRVPPPAAPAGEQPRTPSSRPVTKGPEFSW